MITLSQVINNAYVFAKVMNSQMTFERAICSIYNITGLNVTINDLKTIIRLRVEYRNFDNIFNVYE